MLHFDEVSVCAVCYVLVGLFIFTLHSEVSRTRYCGQIGNKKAMGMSLLCKLPFHVVTSGKGKPVSQTEVLEGNDFMHVLVKNCPSIHTLYRRIQYSSPCKTKISNRQVTIQLSSMRTALKPVSTNLCLNVPVFRREISTKKQAQVVWLNAHLLHDHPGY